MDFSDALRTLVFNYCSLKRESWHKCYIEYNEFNDEIEYNYIENGFNYVNHWTPKQEDILADDWIII